MTDHFTYFKIAFIYLAIINVVTFFVYGIDKLKAKRSKWRIPEATLLGLAVIGGSIGAWLGMKVWHHKTLHKKFKYGVPLILIIQIALVLLCSCGATKHSHSSPHSNIASDTEHSPSVFTVMYDMEVVDKAFIEDILIPQLYEHRRLS